jgi:hypothetical protein
MIRLLNLFLGFVHVALAGGLAGMAAFIGAGEFARLDQVNISVWMLASAAALIVNATRYFVPDGVRPRMASTSPIRTSRNTLAPATPHEQEKPNAD